MKKKQAAFQKLKTWWHNLPHKWFLVFQLCLPFVFYLSLFLVAHSLFFIFATPFLLIIQLYFIKHYYGWKKLFGTLLILLVLIFGAYCLYHIDLHHRSIYAISAYWFLFPFIYTLLSLLIQRYLKEILLLAFLLIFVSLFRYKIINCYSSDPDIFFDTPCDIKEYALFWTTYPITNRKRYYELQKENQNFEQIHELYFQENKD